MTNNKYNDIIYIMNTTDTNGFIKYDVKANIDSLDMVIGRKYNISKYKNIEEPDNTIVFDFLVNNKVTSIEELDNYDFLGNDKLIPLANKRALEFLIKLCPDDFEYFDTIIIDKLSNKKNKNYKLINILSMVSLADKKESIIEECYVKDDIIFGYYTKLVLKKNNTPKNKYIFRDIVNNGITKYVSSRFVEEYTNKNLTGLKFRCLENINKTD